MKKPPAQRRQTTHAVGRKATPAKPAAPVSSHTGGKGTATHKHGSAPAKHQPRRARKWTPDGDVALCSARAFAESLRLSGRGAVSDSAVLDVYWSTAADADAGASILATAEAILAEGLGGYAGSALPLELPALEVRAGTRTPQPLPTWDASPRVLSHLPIALILGLDLPWGEPHAVTVGLDGTWWSWGEPYSPADFPGAVIDEAWEVTWS